MIEVCFWCKKLIGKVKPKYYAVKQQGICPDCAEVLRKKYRMSAALDSQDIDVLVKLLAK